MLQALGYGILDRDGNQIPPGAQGLAQIASISSEHVLPELSECTFRIACDVNNPLCGPRGASAVYGPQKGADEAMVPILRSVVTLEEAMDPENARKNMADTAEQVFRLVQAVQPMQAV